MRGILTFIKTQRLFIFLILLFGTLPYFSSLFYFFSQDDFIHFSAAKIDSFGGFLNFFNPHSQFPDIFFFRPLATQVYFFVNNTIFGQNPFFFHLEALILHIINGIHVYLITKLVWKQEKVAKITTLLYLISAVHFLNFYYISAFQQIARTTFVLVAILSFIKFEQSSKKKYLIFTILSFIAALLCKETSLILPLLLIPVEIIRKNPQPIKKIILDTSKKSWPLYAVIVGYILFRIIGLQTIFGQGGYDISFSLTNIFQNLKWYLLWIFGLPEIISTYPSLNIQFLKQFTKDSNFGLYILISFFIFLITTIMLINKKVLGQRNIIYLGGLFLIPLLPVLPLVQHKYPQYLDLSLLGLLPILSMFYIQSKRIQKVFIYLAIISFITLQILSIELSEDTHWTTHRSEVAKYYYDYLKSQPLEGKDNIVFTGDPTQLKEVSVTLAKDYAINVWYPGKFQEVKYMIRADISSNALIIPITKF